MDSLAPPLRCVRTVIAELECGSSLRNALMRYVKLKNDSFCDNVAHLIFLHEQRGDIASHLRKQKNSLRETLLEIFHSGLNGQSIFERLKEIEKEAVELTKAELDEHISKLTFLLLPGLVLFLFPAFLILLLGPLVLSLLGGLK